MSINDDFSITDFTNWTIYGTRNWYISNGLLYPQDAVAYAPGFIINNTTILSDGTLEIFFTGLDAYNAVDNAIILKFQDVNHFYSVKMNPGYADARGLYFNKNSQAIGYPPVNMEPGSVRVPLYNKYGKNIDTEIYPNKTTLDQTGSIIITISGSRFDFTWKNRNGTVLATGTHYDSTYAGIAGNVGFFHTAKWNKNIIGWGAIIWEDLHLPPTIQSFYPSTNPILVGTSTSANWVVTSGNASTTVEMNTESVGLIGTSAISNLGTYQLSAYNAYGSDYKSFELSSYCDKPTIDYFYANSSNVAIGQNVDIFWNVTGGTAVPNVQVEYNSSIISNELAGISAVTILSAVNLFTLLAENICGSATTNTSFNVSGYGIPPKIQSFYPAVNPILSGTSTSALWVVTSGNANTTTLFENNSVDLSGTSAISTVGTYQLSAFNTYGSDYKTFELSAYANSATEIPPKILEYYILPNPAEVCHEATHYWNVLPGNSPSVTLFIDGVEQFDYTGTLTFTQNNMDTETKYAVVSGTYGEDTASVELSSTYNAPAIEYFFADNPIILLDDFTFLRWKATKGSCDITVDMNGNTVNSTDILQVSPLVATTYTLNATDGTTTVTSSVTIQVSATPIVLNFSASTSDICENGSVDISWNTQNASSVFMLPGGWCATSGTATFPNIVADTTYEISAFNGNQVATSALTVNVLVPPSIIDFSPEELICPNISASYSLNWQTSGTITSACIREFPSYQLVYDLSASEYLSGTYVSDVDNFPLELFVSNKCGGDYDVIETAFHSNPIASAGNDITLHTHYLSGVPVELTGEGSYDVDGGSLTYNWLSGADSLATSESFTSAYKIGTHNLQLQVFNSCMLSAYDFVTVNVSALPPIAIVSASKLLALPEETVYLDASSSTDYYGEAIVNYSWYKNYDPLVETDPIISATDTSGIQRYTVVVEDKYGLSAQDSIVVRYKTGSNPTAIASPLGTFCNSTNGVMITFIGTSSIAPSDGSTIVNACWDLTTVGGSIVCKDIDSKYDLTLDATINMPVGTYNVPFTISASNGNTDSDIFSFNLQDRPTFLYSGASEYNLSIFCGLNYVEQEFEADPITSANTILWNDGTTITSGSSIVKRYYKREEPYKLYVYSTNGICKSYADEITIYVTDDNLKIEKFYVSNLEYFETYMTGFLNWNIPNATSAFIDNDIGFKYNNEAILGSVAISADTDKTFRISAFDANCRDDKAASVKVTLGQLTKCKLKTKYIKLTGNDDIRFGTNRLIDIKQYSTSDYYNTDAYKFLELLETYLNTMYDGKLGYQISALNVEVSACNQSACLLSAVDNHYTLSANETITHGNEVDIVNIYKDCILRPDKISILEKIFRLTELFDPELIPLELINFYSSNMGYNVGINKEQVGYGSNQSVEQKKYLRFMMSNLPYWYQIKTTKSAVKMMLYSFGLIGDFVYYYTSDYLNHGQTTNNPEFEVLKNLNYDALDFQEFSENRKKYYKVLQDLQFEHSNWIASNWNPTQMDEDVTNIPNDFFPTPHFTLYFDILSSLTNVSYERNRTNAIRSAIMAIKPLNTVYDGIVGYFAVKLKNYIMHYIKTSRHLRLPCNNRSIQLPS